MKKNKFLYILLLSVLFVACDKEDNLTPSNLGKDWFTIENSDDPVDRAIYQFYVETGIPVFYNDTIGQETRVDNWGNSYTHYEILQFSSSALGGTETPNPFSSYELCPREYVVDGLEFLREEIVPVLPESIKIRSFLLLKSLTPYNSATSKEAFKGLNTVLISRVTEFRDMSDVERQNMKGAVLNAVLATPISAYAEELAVFYQTTRGYYTQVDLYGCSAWRFYNTYGFSDPRSVGFLKDPNPYDYGNMPTETQDVGMYISAIFTFTPEEFEAAYGAFDAVMTKYRIIVSVLKEIGVSI
jgi:lipoprotein